MERKKQLLSWILSFLMVFSIMPIMSISAFAETYDNNHMNLSNTLKPGDIIENSNSGDAISIFYEGLEKSINVPIGEQHTVCDAKVEDLAPPSDEVMFLNWKVNEIGTSSGVVTGIKLTPNWRKKAKITYDSTNTNVGEEEVEVTKGNKQVIDGVTNVTTGSAVTITIKANDPYKLPDTIKVEMGVSVLGDSEYKYDQATGKIEIGNVIGDVKITAKGVEANNSSSSSSSSHKNKKVEKKIEISDVEPYEDKIIEGLNNSSTDKIRTNIDSNPNLLLSSAIIDALKANNKKSLIIVSNNVSTELKINEAGQIVYMQNNKPISGFRTICNAEYCLDVNGIMKTGWLQESQETPRYYFDSVTGIKKKGWYKDLDGKWYMLDKTTGVMAKGWFKATDGLWYYLDGKSGKMLTGWHQDVDGKWYYLHADGSMAHDTVVDGYYVKGDGVCV